MSSSFPIGYKLRPSSVIGHRFRLSSSLGYKHPDCISLPRLGSAGSTLPTLQVLLAVRGGSPCLRPGLPLMSQVPWQWPQRHHMTSGKLAQGSADLLEVRKRLPPLGHNRTEVCGWRQGQPRLHSHHHGVCQAGVALCVWPGPATNPTLMPAPFCRMPLGLSGAPVECPTP